MDLYIVEYSITQNAFNINLLGACIETNIKNALNKNYTDYQIVGIGNYEQCVEICDKLRKELDKQPKIIKENVTLNINGIPFICKCGANVFSKTDKGTYICHGCNTIYDEEIKSTS